MERIAIVGASGSGKSTLGKQIGERLGIPSIELDSLSWEFNWQLAPNEVFLERVQAALAGPRWVVDGNYSRARPISWGRADTLVWLDYPLWFILGRLFRRTLRRIVTQEELWSGNRENFRGAFLSRDSIFLWVLQSRPRHHREYPRLLEQPEYRHLELIRLYSPRQTQAFLDRL